LQPGEKIGIVTRDGVSYLILDDVTYNHAGKYEVLVENPLGKDRKFFSLAVEGKLSVYIILFSQDSRTQKFTILIANKVTRRYLTRL